MSLAEYLVAALLGHLWFGETACLAVLFEAYGVAGPAFALVGVEGDGADGGE